MSQLLLKESVFSGDQVHIVTIPSRNSKRYQAMNEEQQNACKLATKLQRIMRNTAPNHPTSYTDTKAGILSWLKVAGV